MRLESRDNPDYVFNANKKIRGVIECPISCTPDWIKNLWSTYALAKELGIAPFSGSLGEQPSYIVEALETFSIERNVIDRWMIKNPGKGK